MTLIVCTEGIKQGMGYDNQHYEIRGVEETYGISCYILSYVASIGLAFECYLFYNNKKNNNKKQPIQS